ncbi:uncharacterized protein METZ01_LOCUS323679 [marine metagenome]|uniref:Uncharacterized protein n=1 Tax=marine metagenome TaxID=408172 RepID=A0A382PDY9_9ZZZZ
MAEYSIELTKMLEDLKLRPGTIRDKWKKLNEGEREIYLDALKKTSAEERAKLSKLINKNNGNK